MILNEVKNARKDKYMRCFAVILKIIDDLNNNKNINDTVWHL